MSSHFASPSKGVDLRATNTRTSHQQHHIRAASTKLLPSFKKSQERPIILTSEFTQKLREMPRRTSFLNYELPSLKLPETSRSANRNNFSHY